MTEYIYWICDRCGKKTDTRLRGYYKQPRRFFPDWQQKTEEWELCSDCAGALLRFMKAVERVG